MMERKFEGGHWSELAITWNLPTANSDNIGFNTDYDKLQFFLYIVWKRTVWKDKSFIRRRVAADLREYARALARKKKDGYRYIWVALATIRDDNELIKMAIALVPYMWY